MAPRPFLLRRFRIAAPAAVFALLGGVLFAQTPAPSSEATKPDVPRPPAKADSADAADAAPPKLLFEEAQTSLIQNTVIAAPVAGLVRSVAVVEGDFVRANTVVVQLADELAERELAAAEAAWEAMRLESDNDAAVRYAQRTLEVRAHKLKQSTLANDIYQGSVTELELRQLDNTWDDEQKASCNTTALKTLVLRMIRAGFSGGYQDMQTVVIDLWELGIVSFPHNK